MAQPAVPPAAPLPRVCLVYEVEVHDEQFLLDEETMPENPLHHEALLLLELVLRAWALRTGRSPFVGRNLACRWNPADVRLGVDPDLVVVEPAPVDLDTMKQLRLWEGHAAPLLAIEVVSESTAKKDYLEAPVSYARLGTQELWVFDPRREGPGDTGGPFVLQVWQRHGDRMERIYAGPGPTRSPGLGVWLVVVDGGRRLRLADDPEGARLWPTQAEAEAEARAGERAAREREQAARERAEADQRAERTAREQAEADRQFERSAREQERLAREKAEAEVAELRARLAALASQKPS